MTLLGAESVLAEWGSALGADVGSWNYATGTNRRPAVREAAQDGDSFMPDDMVRGSQKRSGRVVGNRSEGRSDEFDVAVSAVQVTFPAGSTPSAR